jgi:ribosomal protein S11
MASLRWARPLLRQATASPVAGPSCVSKSKFSTSAIWKADDSEAGWADALKVASQSPTTNESPASTFRSSSSSMPGFRATPTPRTVRQATIKRDGEPFHLHVHSTRNNTILCLTDPQNNPITRVSSGMLGFKHTARSSFEAGHQTSIRMFNIISENQTKWRLANLNVVYNGFGQGREALHRALLTDEGAKVRQLVRKVQDSTRIKVGGTRPKKRRSEWDRCSHMDFFADFLPSYRSALSTDSIAIRRHIHITRECTIAKGYKNSTESPTIHLMLHLFRPLPRRLFPGPAFETFAGVLRCPSFSARLLSSTGSLTDYFG